MKTILVFALTAFVLTTGFTCSKNPPAPQTTESQPAQEQMTAPADGAATPAPAPADGTAAPATPETNKEAAPETK